MSEVCSMQNVWHDSLMFITSHVKEEMQVLHVQLKRPDIDDEARAWLKERIQQLTEFAHTIIHWFSLLNAVALSTLQQGEAQALNSLICKHSDFEWMQTTVDNAGSRLDKVRQSFMSGKEQTQHFTYLGKLASEEK